MNVKRQNPRYLVEGMDISAKTIFQTEVEIADISMSGASIHSRKRFTIGCRYLFKFAHKEKVFSIKAAIAWEKLAGSERTDRGDVIPLYSAGITFEDLLIDKAEQLREFIADKVRDMREHRLGAVRVRVHPPEKAMLSYLESSRVKDISLGGLRLAVSREPSLDMRFRLEILLSENDHPIRCRGRIAYCNEQQEEASKRFSVGVELLEMADIDAGRLKYFIEALPSYHEQ
jgi:hypothetical protein